MNLSLELSDPVQPLISSENLQVNLIYGPAIAPLNFDVITSSHEETHEILAKVVDDLSQWLSAAEVGLTQILDAMGEDWALEEQCLGVEVQSVDVVDTSGQDPGIGVSDTV